MIFKKTITRPLPKDSKIIQAKGETFAVWSSRGKKKYREKVIKNSDGQYRLACKSKTWYCRYRNDSGVIVEVNTGCHDKEMARGVALQYVRRRELVISGTLTPTEAATMDWANTQMSDHIEDFLNYNTDRGICANTCKSWDSYLKRVIKECHFNRLSDYNKVVLERWLMDQVKNGMSARTHNAYIQAMTAFGKWLVREDRTIASLFQGLQKRNEKIDRKRVRRALTYEEASLLIEAAKNRPLDERSSNKGSKAKLRSETIDSLKWLGEMRSMAYRIMLWTGLRYGELRSIVIGDVYLNETNPYIELKPENEKARRGAKVPLHTELAADLKEYIGVRIQRISKKSETGDGCQNERLLDLPEKANKVFDRDIAFAKIPKQNELGQTIDVHALRTTFVTWLAKAGVTLQAAQKLARHSDPKITANIYTDLPLKDLAGSVEALQYSASENSNSHVAL